MTPASEFETLLEHHTRQNHPGPLATCTLCFSYLSAEAPPAALQRGGKYCVDCGVLIDGGGTDRSMLDPNICWECGEGQFV